MVRGSFDTDGLRSSADQISRTAASLAEIESALRGIPSGACPRIVDQALDELARNGSDMISDIDEETTALSQKMRQAAQIYDGLEQSMVRYFRSGP
ncbi:hypothetical protein Q0Z83_024190 [Actinoplanes sichuanensis]|uniref:Excreted virulence factor EspC, type VII ESX diderm n=1 Tax=Actinoplanes sichuanensis TaxID=512349 RepID=A0ABW4A1V0_9ACTN|nr:hypothetical protein [Actinoplanes sichuanensis]BEL04228.1 hypothetical protein Q0Z83_024190 [Actinoplanes sichuanensis]